MGDNSEEYKLLELFFAYSTGRHFMKVAIILVTAYNLVFIPL